MPRDLTPVQTLTVILQRLEERAAVLEGVGMNDYRVAAYELRVFARMVKAARDYLVLRGRMDGPSGS